MSMASPTEIAVLIIIAVVMFGPEKVPQYARKAARVFHYLRNIANNTRDHLREDLGPKYADLEIQDLNPKNFVRKYVLEEFREDIDGIKSDLSDVRDDITDVRSDLRSATGDAVDAVDDARSSASATSVAVAERTIPTPFDLEAT
ncbi:MAG: sec-independent translocase [Acidipropionibacterium acidipropionici]|jgi:sec-independent protein translocase protein TatB|uniref:Translocase n=2 Tax=Acidipropionibacterium acidipropionici TaxID=1748 RepID=A0AAC8YHA9_9ACTN|nr:sec-independent translocase [Acidipropionibacterium acidipropionici]AFV88999.1 MttA/ family protein [Acidipropionibacterium acidipropionici ATCC 4875]AMS06698.1 translocase [Acidipropionibacterium acidipropionici]AOZ45486.1 translocase [Acidipropionibacterium acidipropionici]AZP38510.1 Sec-independent protein translocase subunit TatB [Acidipropionibacterium acidipropionici]QCV95453.1 Sec-independent protein translocase subunit TatB [Acidipropionibacterium acidipropionici]